MDLYDNPDKQGVNTQSDKNEIELIAYDVEEEDKKDRRFAIFCCLTIICIAIFILLLIISISFLSIFLSIWFFPRE